MSTREDLRTHFLSHTGWRDASIVPLEPDASFRRYYRLHKDTKSIMLMDAPPDLEDSSSFVRISNHLSENGIRAPWIEDHDETNGFILLEDLGDETFTRLLTNGADESSLYQQAVSVLIDMTNNRGISDIELGFYGFEECLEEAELFLQWYLPAITKMTPQNDLKQSFKTALLGSYSELPAMPSTLVLRDFHVDNLIMHHGKCHVLDYQDALIGSPAYDVVSLLEDARRSISQNFQNSILEYYLSETSKHFQMEDFMAHYQFWGMQRHLKVLGIFTRLWQRDKKPIYLQHLPRVARLLDTSLKSEIASPVRKCLKDNDISLSIDQLPGYSLGD